MNFKSKILIVALTLGFSVTIAMAKEPSELNDLEIAHVAYTADLIDIKYAHLALAISNNQDIHDFARTMIRDHEAVNKQALGLLKKLGAQAQNNKLSQTLNEGATVKINELSKLRGADFDMAYASNELGYHKAVNDLVENAFIPNIENAEVKTLFQAGLKIFKAHQDHAEMMVKKLKG